MKFRKKATFLLLSLCVFVLGLSVLLGSTFFLRADSLRKFYQSYISRAVLQNLTVLDCNGETLYSGKFAEDRALRLALFPLLGDKNGSLPDSLLTRITRETAQNGKWHGYSGEKQTVSLTIDRELQLAAWNVLEKTGLDGCIVVLDSATGALRAMVSSASVDVMSSETPAPEAYLNKALCAYAPGSVFKAVTVAAILEKGEDVSSFSYTCTGADGDIRCLGVHGKVDLAAALYKSCNCAIAKAARQFLSAEELNEFARGCGILSPDLLAGMSAQRGQIDANDHFGWSASGQSKDLTTPLAVAAYYSAIANGGILPGVWWVDGGEDREEDSNGRRIFSEATAEFLQNALTVGMEQWYSSPLIYDSFGKTGTAEVDGKEPHAWFVCSLVQEDVPPYTVAVFLKNGGNSISARTAAAELINSFPFSK